MSKTAKPKSWRDVIKVHPAADLFPMMPPDELKALGEDIKKNGLLSAPTLWEADKGEPRYLLDGRNRFDAMEAVGLPVLNTEGKWLGWNVATRCNQMRGDDPYAYVLSANVHRRHLTAEQKRDIVAKVLKAQPTKSNRTIAKQTSVDHKTVGAVREQMEGRGEIPHVSTVEDTKGRKQPAKKNRRDVDDFLAEKRARKAEPEPQQVDLEDLTEQPPSEENPIRAAWLNASKDQRREFAEAHGDVAGELARRGRRGPDAPISDRIYETCDSIEAYLHDIPDEEQREDIRAQYADLADQLDELRDRADELFADEDEDEEDEAGCERKTATVTNTDDLAVPDFLRREQRAEPVSTPLCKGEAATIVRHDTMTGTTRDPVRWFEVKKGPDAQYPVALLLSFTLPRKRRKWSKWFHPCDYQFFTIEQNGQTFFDSRKHLACDMDAFLASQRKYKAEWLVAKAKEAEWNAAHSGSGVTVRSCQEHFEEESAT